MKQGAYLINNSRGTVVDLDALAAALRDGHLRGAAVDVFPVEPGSNEERFVSPLQGLRQRDPDPACRRLDRGGPGAHRRRGRAQAGRLQRHRLDHRRGELPAGAAAAAPDRARASSMSIATCRACSPAERGVLRARRQHRRAISTRPTARSATWCWTPTAPARTAATLLAEIRAIEGTIRARLLYERR